MPSFTDQTGRSIELHSIPRRIVSLVPSQTELLSYFGLDEEVVGITKFCVHPDQWFKTKTGVGGTKQVSMEAIHALQPDLIIANKEENVKEQIEALAKHYPVWVSDVNNLDDAYSMISSLAAITGKPDTLVGQIKEAFENLGDFPPVRTAYLIWRKPYMAAGKDTFIHDMLRRCGFINIIDKERYPEVSIEELRECDVVLLSSEPFPFSKKHIDELQLPAMLVDGEMFSWYGSRLLHAPAYFAQLRSVLSRAFNFT